MSKERAVLSGRVSPRPALRQRSFEEHGLLCMRRRRQEASAMVRVGEEGIGVWKSQRPFLDKPLPEFGGINPRRKLLFEIGNHRYCEPGKHRAGFSHPSGFVIKLYACRFRRNDLRSSLREDRFVLPYLASEAGSLPSPRRTPDPTGFQHHELMTIMPPRNSAVAPSKRTGCPEDPSPSTVGICQGATKKSATCRSTGTSG